MVLDVLRVQCGGDLPAEIRAGALEPIMGRLKLCSWSGRMRLILAARLLVGTPRPFHAVRIHGFPCVRGDFTPQTSDSARVERPNFQILTKRIGRTHRWLLKEAYSVFRPLFMTVLRTSATTNVFEVRPITLRLAFGVFSVSPSGGFHVYQSPACNLRGAYWYSCWKSQVSQNPSGLTIESTR